MELELGIYIKILLCFVYIKTKVVSKNFKLRWLMRKNVLIFNIISASHYAILIKNSFFLNKLTKI